MIDNFNERLQQVASSKKIFQAELADAIGKDRSTVNKWWNGSQVPGPRNMRLLADYLGCSVKWLETGTGTPFPKKVTAVLDEQYDIKNEAMGAKQRRRGGSALVPLVAVPLLGRVPAGIPEQIEEQVEDYVAFPGVDDGTYALRAHGESMVPAIRHDDFVLFRIDQDVRPGQVVVVNNEFGESMLKRLKEKEGELWLTSDNPEYPAVRPNAHYRIMGVVVRVIRDVPF